jgi:hypothetical protein
MAWGVQGIFNPLQASPDPLGNRYIYKLCMDLFTVGPAADPIQVRIGPTIEDSSVGWCGDDFLNIKNTLMLLLRCDSATSCVVINPHGPDSSVGVVKLVLSAFSIVNRLCMEVL